MTADPRNPKKGDRFVGPTPPGRMYEVDYVGDEALFAHNVETGRETFVELSHAAKYWKPVPEPLVIYELRAGPAWWTSNEAVSVSELRTGRRRVLHPDGTWTEEGP